MPKSLRLLVATKKGAWMFQAHAARRRWSVSAPIQFGEVCHHFVQDPREPRRMLMAAKAGRAGPSVFVSVDAGRSWKEASRPPAFPKATDGGAIRAVDHVFALVPGHASEAGVWYAGTSPQGLFRSEDGGYTWNSVDGFNQHRMRKAWCGEGRESPPGGGRLHSIEIDPRDPRRVYIALSTGGVFETTDGGGSWTPLNKGCAADFLPKADAEYGHNPHCLKLHPKMPDRLYQQNQCGVYRLDRPSKVWERIGDKMPKTIGDIGFPIVLHPEDPDTAWVFPMDGAPAWPRTSPGGKPAVYVTRNAGKLWKRLDKGLPAANGWFTVVRQAMTADACSPLGLYFGTTQGELWASRDEGAGWKCVARHLPRIHSVAPAFV